MTTASTLYQRACDVFDSRVRTVASHQWDAPAPTCPAWTVRDLVNHVTVEELWAPPLLEGKTLADVGDAFDGDQLGADPVAAWSEAVAAAKAAAAVPGVEACTVHLSYGDEPAGEYLSQMFADALIHAWDLAVATGGDTRLPEDLVAACATWWAERKPAFQAAGVIGPDGSIADEVPVGPGADAQTRLLAAVGRDASRYTV